MKVFLLTIVRFIHVPLLLGDDTNEGSLFVSDAASPADVSTFMLDQYPNLTLSDTASINLEYPLMPSLPTRAAYFPSLSAAYGEACFICPGISILQSYSNNTFKSTSNSSLASPRLFSYRYAVTDASNNATGLGTPHTFEIPAIFGVDATGASDSSYETYNAPIVPVVMDYFMSFVRALDPNVYKSDAAPVWDEWSAGGGNGTRVLLQTNETVMEDVPSEQLERCEFWRGLRLDMQL